MDFKKILILGVLLVVVFSAVGAVSAGLFDFLEEDNSFTVQGHLIDGSANTTLWDDNVGDYHYHRDLSCDVEVAASEEQLDKISSFSMYSYCNITYGNGTSEVFQSSDNTNFELSMEGNIVHITAERAIYTPVKFEDTHCGISGGTLVLPGEDGNITIEF